MVETKETIQETAKLVRRAQGGDEEALEAFLREIQPGIFRRFLRLLGNQADAEDMTQDILIKVLENLPDLRDPMAAPAWVKRIVETSCINGMRKTKDYVFEDEEQSGAVFDNLVEETVDALPGAYMDMYAKRKIITQMIDELPEKQKNVVYLSVLIDQFGEPTEWSSDDYCSWHDEDWTYNFSAELFPDGETIRGIHVNKGPAMPEMPSDMAFTMEPMTLKIPPKMLKAVLVHTALLLSRNVG